VDSLISLDYSVHLIGSFADDLGLLVRHFVDYVPAVDKRQLASFEAGLVAVAAVTVAGVVPVSIQRLSVVVVVGFLGSICVRSGAAVVRTLGFGQLVEPQV